MTDPSPVLPWTLSDKPIPPMKRAGMLVDLRRCTGCHACAVSCKTEHNVPLGDFRIRTHYVERPKGLQIAFIPTLCMHCEDAPCMGACPHKAIERQDDGRVVINEGRCDAEKVCIDSCPYDAIFLNEATQTAEKCNFCEHRTEIGMDPACVEACPTSALRFGDLGNTKDPLTQYIEQHKDKVRAYKASEGTKPSVLYINHEDWMESAAPGVQRSPVDQGIIYE